MRTEIRHGHEWRWLHSAACAAGLALSAAVAACGSSSGGGAKLALGTEATIAYIAPASGDTAAVDTTLGVTVLAVRIGTQAELSAGGMEADAEAKTAIPYYVDVRYSNKGAGALTRNLSVGMEDTKGNSVPTTLITTLGGEPFALCKDVNSGTLQPGESYEGCTLILVPAGRTVDRVRFVSQAPDAKITFTDWATK
jgi:hypothetical protein